VNAREGRLVLAATTGGHLAQLAELARRLPPDLPRRWMTFEGPQPRSLLAGEDVTFLPFIAERDVGGVLRALPLARRVLTQEGPVAAVVSTGSAIALALLPLAALHGIPAHYIESAARTGAPSLTGRALAAVPGVRLYRQYAHLAGGRWRYGGSVFEGFVGETLPPQPVRRVVVTLGTMAQGFRRLLERLLRILPPGAEVLWQTGETPTGGLGIAAQRFLPAAVLAEEMARADVVVAHAGCGSALTALMAGRCPILVPRDPADGEVVDDHQAEIAAWLDAQGLALARSVERLAAGDLALAAARRVHRAAAVPPFRLAEAA
jgi:UDP-N-acetylglucosamine transferase subunit ALG13